MKAVQKAIFKSLVLLILLTVRIQSIKKPYKLTLTKDSDGSNEYRSRMGLNLYQLPLGFYKLVVEFSPPEMSNISVTASGQTIYITNQTTKIFSNYAKTLIKFIKITNKLHITLSLLFMEKQQNQTLHQI